MLSNCQIYPQIINTQNKIKSYFLYSHISMRLYQTLSYPKAYLNSRFLLNFFCTWLKLKLSTGLAFLFILSFSFKSKEEKLRFLMSKVFIFIWNSSKNLQYTTMTLLVESTLQSKLLLQWQLQVLSQLLPLWRSPVYNMICFFV